ncbi:phage tail protein [Paenibacillus sp. N3/727]|uniref:tail fiber protein n=1 Tax=Paenibacillus sp. N3/727 TaxID=2925845 RepID=UPI001F5384CA|nr:phage tail protein [Paenibacillus sp. N3/727]UNK17653.1 phage tail protein [Paenibacillus sp. N3/727]
MSKNTPNLGLLKKDPMVDGNETFNIKTMLNDNWDKIDEAVGNVRVEIPDASTTQKGIVQLSNAIDSESVTEAATPKSVLDATKYTDTKISSTRSEIQKELSNLKASKADLASPVFSGTPKVGTANIVTSSNISSYVKPPENFDGRSGEITLTVGSGKMFSTIQQAIDSLPAFRAYSVTIKPDIGTYSGFSIKDKHGGDIGIYAGYGVNITINSIIKIEDCSSKIFINTVTVTENVPSAMSIEGCSYVGINNLTKRGKEGLGFYIYRTQNVFLYNCNLSNLNSAVRISEGGFLFVDSCTGSGNYCVYDVSSAIVFDSSPNLTGSQRILRQSYGGRVFS